MHVADVARANMLALTADPEVSGSFNIASGNPHTILELATELWRARAVPSAQPEVTGEWRLGDVRHVQASPALAASVLGFEAKRDGEGVADLLEKAAAGERRSANRKGGERVGARTTRRGATSCPSATADVIGRGLTESEGYGSRGASTRTIAAELRSRR